jgi:hypothetical protein
MANFGLIIIIVAWLVQLTSRGKNILTNFILLYCLGVVFLVIDGWQSNLRILALLNFTSLLVALLVFGKNRK